MSEIRLDEDMHVHSTFSDGKDTIIQNVDWALRKGLNRLGCVDHVRSDTTWVPSFVKAVRSFKATNTIELKACIEAKLLDEKGTLDLPANIKGVDYIYAADHQFPIGNKHYHPDDIKKMLEHEELSEQSAIKSLINAVQGAQGRYPNIVIAHLFSILPKVGISEESVPDSLLVKLAQKAADYGTIVEADERWRCPSIRTLGFFKNAGVPIVLSSDAHCKEAIGSYRYNLDIAIELGRR